MPEAPRISGISVDSLNHALKENVINIKSLSYLSYSSSSSSGYYLPFSLNIEDNTPSPDFYSFQIEYYNKVEYEGGEYESEYQNEYENGYEKTDLIDIATSNLAMIQDNPDVESLDLMLDGENYDLYSFDLMMLTDATFANTNIRLDLYTPDSNIYYGYIKPDQLMQVYTKYTLTVRHHTQEAFKQYRSMAFQLAGLGFFSEPVFITSNMENAYGGFSLQNTSRILLYEKKVNMGED
jgi:hypothetical protein